MHASAFIHLRKITNTAEHNDDRNPPIHQNEEQCNFVAHQAPVTLWMGELYYSRRSDGAEVSARAAHS